ncbi:MAG: HDOD domain-containing protein, partial [FCB group bacterium]
MKDIQEMVNKVEDFPTLPTIYTSLLDVMANTRTTVQDVANVITRDQASSTKILKIVNSSLYGMQTNVETITEAIFYIGFNEVKNIVMTLSVLDLFEDVKSLMNFNVVELWKHSIAVGVITRNLGKSIGEKDVENYFLAGVLHDIGKLFFLKNYNDEYYDVIREVSEHKISISEAEEMVFGMTHCTVGHLLSEKWKLPATLKFSILNHQTGTSNGKTDKLVSCVHIA